MSEEKVKRNIRSKVVIHWNYDKTKWWYQFEDKDGIILCSSEYDTEKECRERIQRIRKVTKNRFMKIEVYSGE